MGRRQTPGVLSTPAVLARIDATVHGGCACGCGRPLPPDGQSVWYASERCQLAWYRGEVNAPPDLSGEVMRYVVGNAADYMVSPVFVEPPQTRVGRFRRRFFGAAAERWHGSER